MKITLRNDKKSKYLVKGVEYTVFAMYLESPIKFMIQADSLPAAPYCISLDDVEIVDNRLSKFWLFGDVVPSTNDSMKRPAILAFPDWINDIYFYQNIVESQGNSGEIWQGYRTKMELEFAPSDLVKTAALLDDGWLQCADCFDAWLPEFEGEVVTCPSCSTVQRRPGS